MSLEAGKSETEQAGRVRSLIARGFGHFEDVVYVGLGLLTLMVLVLPRS